MNVDDPKPTQATWTEISAAMASTSLGSIG